MCVIQTKQQDQWVWNGKTGLSCVSALFAHCIYNALALTARVYSVSTAVTWHHPGTEQWPRSSEGKETFAHTCALAHRRRHPRMLTVKWQCVCLAPIQMTSSVILPLARFQASLFCSIHQHTLWVLLCHASLQCSFGTMSAQHSEKSVGLIFLR